MTIIKNARIIKNNELEKVNILIDDGKIKEITVHDIPFSGEKEIDAHGNMVFPGFIDPHVHFDDPGFTEREDFETGTRSAAAGGITTVIDMPCTSIPPVINGRNFDYKLKAVHAKAYVDFAFWGGVTPEQIVSGQYKKSLNELAVRGIVGVKFYTVSSMDLYPRMSVSNMDTAFRALKEMDLVCAVHAEDYELVEYYSRILQKMGRKDAQSWAEGRTYAAEPIAIWSVAGITEKIGNKLHIVHLSSLAGLNVIRWAREHQLDVTAETCPQYLLFTLEDFIRVGSILKIAPPLRRKEDVDGLWEGLRDGSIDFISTDHAAGKFPEEKSSPDIWKNYAGIPGIQLAISSMIHYGYHKGRLSLAEIQKLMSEKAAKRYGLYPRKGVIQKGSDADFTIIDINKEWGVNASALESKGRYSPLADEILRGEIVMTIVRGEVVYSKAEGGIIGKKGYGRLLLRK